VAAGAETDEQLLDDARLTHNDSPDLATDLR